MPATPTPKIAPETRWELATGKLRSEAAMMVAAVTKLAELPSAPDMGTMRKASVSVTRRPETSAPASMAAAVVSRMESEKC